LQFWLYAILKLLIQVKKKMLKVSLVLKAKQVKIKMLKVSLVLKAKQVKIKMLKVSLVLMAKLTTLISQHVMLEILMLQERLLPKWKRKQGMVIILLTKKRQ